MPELPIVTLSVTIGNMNTSFEDERVRAPELADWLLSRGLVAVTTAQAAQLLGVPPDQVRRRLHAPARRGEWVMPAHGLWMAVHPEYRTWGAPPGIEIVDTVMRHLHTDYYVGWLSAAEIHGAAHQAPQVFQVATSRHIRAKQVGRTRFTFMTRESVGAVPVIERPTRSGHARVSTREATILDVAADIDIAGGVTNAATVIAELADDDGIDVGTLADLAHNYPAAAGRRAGWVLDRFGPELELEPLRDVVQSKATAPSLLDAAGPTTSELDRDWRLRVNRDVEVDV
ncbi:Transcriptional regulator, predicted component of viral defense system [Jiangella alba]|uniref:Transcriptional regulator, predicted component of viral defense system n=2 Tax=Jiangella alba TaxID=561176 RepID=A0A1H5PQR3_9ACTN|nr:Transcriptional regulator, predicted component of viral defense system [Jiangella alba]